MADAPKKRTFPCPKCNRTLVQSGELLVGGITLPVFQCDECLMRVNFAGEATELALTFAVDAQGRAFDPADPNGQLLF